MKWTKEADEAVSRVPFFVRRRVRKRVEEEARRSGAKEVSPEHVRSCQQKFLKNMESEVRGYRIETCFGPGGCKNRAVEDADLVQRLERLVSGKDLKAFLKERVNGPLKIHHEFCIVISDCPNACSRPQISDVGIIGAWKPRTTDDECSECAACLESCREEAIVLAEGSPIVDEDRCLFCGQCIRVCPTGSIREAERGYRLLLGGKLGRHPQLGKELPGIYPADKVLELIDHSLHHFMKHNEKGERFGDILNRTGFPADIIHGCQ
ncbi:4Fe-4S binding protein [Desulfococcaceae bacterium HSG8]|nr:4Fe-4S binding protein [Desulfococcaceae bacterium HSG8]